MTVSPVPDVPAVATLPATAIADEPESTPDLPSPTPVPPTDQTTPVAYAVFTLHAANGISGEQEGTLQAPIKELTAQQQVPAVCAHQPPADLDVPVTYPYAAPLPVSPQLEAAIRALASE